jgi:hypothetical protein
MSTATPNNFEFRTFKQKYLNKNSKATNTNINTAYRNFMINRLLFAMNISNPNPRTKKNISLELNDDIRNSRWVQKQLLYGISYQCFPANNEMNGSRRKFYTITKSEKEIKKELEKAEKYGEWVQKKKLYGIILPNLPLNYEYTVMDGSTRKFSAITNLYCDGQINTPVFDYVGSNSNYVGQRSFKIVPNSRRLNTFGIASCSGLTMKLGNKKFLSHIDAITDTSKMLLAIHDCLRNQKLTTSDISNVKIYRGPQTSNRSYEIILELLKSLSIPQNKIEVVIANDGKCSI